MFLKKIADEYGIGQTNLHAYVFGEHGDSSFIPWSGSFVSGVHVDEYHTLMNSRNMNIAPLDKEHKLEYVQKSGGTIIKYKGATFYAVAISVCHICKCILNGSGTALTVSTMMHGEYGVDDVCLSALALVGSDGVQTKITTPLTPEETQKMQASAQKLREIIDGLEI